MIEAIGLCKNFGAVRAAQDVSFSVHRGECVGFLGPNGAGKTTTFRMIAGTIGPNAGTVKLAGHDLSYSPIQAKRCLGYMPENPPLYPELTGREYLSYRAELRGIGRKERADEVKRCADKASVLALLDTRIAHLSKGYRQRMAMADALIGNPPILLFDEPTSGLDPNQVLEVRELIRELTPDHAILLSTHVLSEVQATCSRAVVIHEGKVVAQGALDELQKKRAGDRARVIVSGSAFENFAQLETLLRDAELKTSALSQQRYQLEFSLTEQQLLPRVIRLLANADFDILEASPVRAALDEVFSQLTQSTGAEPQSFNEEAQ